ncbi:hypothetical protein N9Z38_01300 [Mariniblastus sp.]|nr:hypothetical protein [Mariniblastus sp.]MDB4379921.1 hypothetical protein [Mariniblastus sp.]MDB4544924.1 hypothetical protein [bacterium]MDB4564568.1 hypothetical protein [Mariniblastus sp.]
MRFSSTFMILTTVFSGYFCIATDAYAQQVIYQNENCAPTEFYKPSDPWTRGKLYNIQTGNSGLFFNCDGEQAKRYSPYICWKPITEKALPTRKGIWNSIKQDIAEVKQRVRDGSCCDLGCTCADCHRARKNGDIGGCAASATNGGCNQKSCESCGDNTLPMVAPAIDHVRLKAPLPTDTLIRNASTTQSSRRPVITPQTEATNHGKKFGLIQYRRPPAATANQ